MPGRNPLSSLRYPWDSLSESQHLECYHGEKVLPEGLHLLGYLDFKEALPYAIGPARHMETMEISFCVRGKMKWCVQGEDIWFKPGDVMITPPGIVHWGEDFHFSPIEIYWLRVNKDLPFLTGQAKKSARQWVLAKDGFHFPAEPGVRDAFECLIREHRKPDAFSAEMCAATLQQMFLSLARSLESEGSKTRPIASIPEKLRKAIGFLDKDTTAILSIEELCVSLGTSPELLRQMFRQHLGLTPLEYQNARRVSLAKTLLAEGKKSITDIAHELGFASSQYFATFFHKNIGVTPREFRGSHASQDSAKPSPEEIVVDF